MRFASLGSGSKGNATLVEGGGTRVLVDCGFTAREAVRRLGLLELSPSELDAILVTHEHGDHVRGVGALATRFGIEVWSTPGTWKQAGAGQVPGLRLFSGHRDGFRIGDLRVMPFPVPHDAREPCQFVFASDGLSFGMLTDAGCVTRYTRDLLRECDALLLECNHDLKMLREGPYPPGLQARVAGRFGHLSNDQAAELVDALPLAQLRHLMVAHISEKNNRPGLVTKSMLRVSADLGSRLTLAEQARPSPWVSV